MIESVSDVVDLVHGAVVTEIGEEVAKLEICNVCTWRCPVAIAASMYVFQGDRSMIRHRSERYANKNSKFGGSVSGVWASKCASVSSSNVMETSVAWKKRWSEHTDGPNQKNILTVRWGKKITPTPDQSHALKNLHHSPYHSVWINNPFLSSRRIRESQTHHARMIFPRKQ